MTHEKIKQLSKHEIIRCLLDGMFPFEEVMTAFNIYPVLYDLPRDVLGFVYCSRQKNYHIVINHCLDRKKQREVFLHELKHIIFDFPKKPYLIGLDMVKKEFEMEADRVAEALMNYGA